MSRNLSVPYKSQWDTDATGSNNDCGPASIAMILNYYGENLTTDQVLQRTGAGKGLISITQMLNAIKSFGYVGHYEAECKPERIRQLIDKDTPPIMLVHYGSLNSTQDKKFKGGHFFVAVGYYADGYFVNDPNFWGTSRQDGDHHNYLTDELEKAWADSYLDKNPTNALIWIERRQKDVKEPVITDKTKIDLGVELGVMEVQAIRSAILDLQRDLKNANTANVNLRSEMEKKTEILMAKLKDCENNNYGELPVFTNPLANLIYQVALHLEGRPE